MKKALTFLLLAALLATPLTGCDKANSDDEPAKTTTKGNDKQPNPASDFEYSITSNDDIRISKYIGSDSNVIIPAEIDGKVVNRIGVQAFANNNSLVSVEIADSVTYIDENAFKNCKNLKTVALSANLQRLESGAFYNCESLEAVTLPKSLQVIGTEVFYNCTALKQINLPGSVTEFGQYVFAKSGLETATIEEGLEIISSGTFSETNIKTIVLPNSIKAIHSMAFAYCANLESVTLNNGIEYIDNSVFGGCPKLKELTIPGSVDRMNEFALYKCGGLEKVYFEGNAPENFIESFRRMEDLPFTVYYHEGAEGFTSPEWNGYKTEIW